MAEPVVPAVRSANLGPRSAELGVDMRPQRLPQDHEFLAQLYASTRRDELAPVPWPEEQKEEFLRQQFEAQLSHYLEHFGDAEMSVLEVRGVEVGRIYRQYRDDEVRLVDIALVPESRGRGLGEALLRDLCDDAEARSLPLRIHVEKQNPALRLYQRLAFLPIEDQGVYWLMEWRPSGAAS